VLQDLSYGYDPAGNVLTLSNAVSGQSETFGYDELDRLIEATGPYCGGSGCTKTYAYDELGNILQKDGLAYTYGQNGAGPHAVTSLSDGSTMNYDANGCMTQQVRGGISWGYVYDREKRLVAVRRNAVLRARYEYDANGGRVKTTVYQASMPTGYSSSGFGTPQGEIVTHFVRGLHERIVDTGVTARHVYVGPLRVVSVASDGRTRYAHGDHLGGTNVTTDETGQERERIEYAPFGQVVAHSISGGSTEEAYFQYTGHRFDEESDLLFMEARYYDPRLGRFLTPDSLVPDVTNPQALNRYTYVLNGPFKYVDPSGHAPEDVIEFVARRMDRAKGAVSGSFAAVVRAGAELGEAVLDGTMAFGRASADFARGVVLGEGAVGSGESPNASVLAGQVLGGEVPLGDARDIAIAGYRAVTGEGDWSDVGWNAAGVIPFVGNTLKTTGRSADVAEALARGGGRRMDDLGTIFVDPKGNAIPTPKGGGISGSPDGRFIQARDAAGSPTGVGIDGPHKAHPDPRAQAPHSHVPGVTNKDGTPWLPIKD
jgi:RHS repeat-associated protein